MSRLKTLGLVSLVSVLAACAASTGGTDDTKPKKDIYASLKSDEVEFHQEQQTLSQESEEFLTKTMAELRAQYARKKYVEANETGMRLIKIDPSLAEAYYWLARIAVDQADMQQAYNMSLKGLSVVRDPYMKRELERVKTLAQMGAN